jgi:GT2 family glycosyltransferase
MVSIIILAHNKCELTKACLEAIAGSDLPFDYELILVDNASTEDMTSLAKLFGGKIRSFRNIRNDSNLPFSEANNRAACEAKGRYLLFLNNDVLVGKNGIRRLVETLMADATLGVAGAKLVFPQIKRVQHAGIEQMLWGYASNYGVGGKIEDVRLNKKRRIFAVTGAMLCIDAQLFGELGGFDEKYRWGYEDLDLCLKSHQIGRGVIYVPEAESLHWESASLQERDRSEDLERNYRRYREKWGEALLVRENNFFRSPEIRNIREAIIFGTGQAARALTEIVNLRGIEVAAYTTSNATGRKDDRFCGKPVLAVADLRRWRADGAILIGTQFFFEIEDLLAGLNYIFPVVS